MKEVLRILRNLRIETSERGNYSQSYANGYTDAISDAIQAVKKMDYIPCCKSDSELLLRDCSTCGTYDIADCNNCTDFDNWRKKQ